MGLLTALFERRSIENPSTPLSSPDDWLYGALGAGKSASGVVVNRETALTYSPFWRGVNLISKDVGKLPLVIDRRMDRGWTAAVEHSAYGLLRHKANDAMTAMVFRTTLQGHALCEGNGYAYIWRNGAGEPDYDAGGLTILNPRQVTPIRYNGTLWYIYQFMDGTIRRLPYTDVIHIKGFSYDGLIGYNLVHKAKETLGLAMGREVYSSVFFRNSAIPKVVIQLPKGASLKPESVTNLRNSWERMHSGLEQSHRTAILEEGAEAKILSFSARDTQLIEGEKISFIHVANILGLPPHKVGGEGRTAYASLEMENQAYLDEGLDTWLVTHEEEYRDKLLTEEEKRRDSHRIRFARNALLRANLTNRGAFYVQMVDKGIFCPDDVLAEEGMNPQPNGIGAKFYRPGNMALIGEDGVITPVLAPPTPTGSADETPPDKTSNDDEPPAKPTPPAAKPKQDAEEEDKKKQVAGAVRSLFAGAVRRMAKRVGLQAERAANDRKRYEAWLAEIRDQNDSTIRETLDPLETAIAAMGGKRGAAPWLAERLRTEFNGLADRCTPAKLPGEVAALSTRLTEDLPAEANELFFR